MRRAQPRCTIPAASLLCPALHPPPINCTVPLLTNPSPATPSGPAPAAFQPCAPAHESIPRSTILPWLLAATNVWLCSRQPCAPVVVPPLITFPVPFQPCAPAGHESIPSNTILPWLLAATSVWLCCRQHSALMKPRLAEAAAAARAPPAWPAPFIPGCMESLGARLKLVLGVAMAL